MYYIKNRKYNGLEIYFDSMPDERTRDGLKRNNWRWHPGKKCWYNFYNSQNERYAMELCGIKINNNSVKDTQKHDNGSKKEDNKSKIETYDEPKIITDGPEFDIEKKHLDSLEKEFDTILEEIEGASDFMGRYATNKGDYDVGLNFKKTQSIKKYDKKRNDIQNWMPEPYRYRVDMVSDDKTQKYYLGVDDIELDGDIRVISFRSDFGRELVDRYTNSIVAQGKKYNINLRRQFDIEHRNLKSYTNLDTNEDIVFRKGITDPFLRQMFEQRRKQDKQVDIFVTIQENQNEIVDVDARKNIIVQGCAGSGKTMVLLHRLSVLDYKKCGYDSSNTLILTPGKLYNRHINGFVSGLNLNRIERISVEEYYIEILNMYSEKFVPKNKISNEIHSNPKYIEYIYSDDFLKQYKEKYREIINKRKRLEERLNKLAKQIGEENFKITYKSDSEFIPRIKREIEHYYSKVTLQERRIEKAEEELKSNRDKKERLDIKRTGDEVETINSINELLPIINEKAGAFIVDMQMSIDMLQNDIDRLLDEEKQLLKESRNRNNDRLSALKNEYTQAAEKKASLEATQNKVKQMSNYDVTGKSNHKILEWLKSLAAYISAMSDEVRIYEDYIAGKEYIAIQDKLEEAKHNLLVERDNAYAEDVVTEIIELYDEIKEYDDFKTFKLIYKNTIHDFLESNNIKVWKATYRHDLYVRILFCMMYYGKIADEYDYICVDEGQDIAVNEYKLIYELNNRDVVFNVYGDTNQLLMPARGVTDWNTLEEQFGMVRYELNENYRNTNQITRFCNEYFNMSVYETGVDGIEVKTVSKDDLLMMISNSDINDDRSVILLSRKMSRKKLINNKKISSKTSYSVEKGKVAVMYVDEVKGIEFSRVYVLTEKMTQNEKYVAYTRALSELVVVKDE